MENIGKRKGTGQKMGLCVTDMLRHLLFYEGAIAENEDGLMVCSVTSGLALASVRALTHVHLGLWRMVRESVGSY